MSTSVAQVCRSSTVLEVFLLLFAFVCLIKVEELLRAQVGRQNLAILFWCEAATDLGALLQMRIIRINMAATQGSNHARP